MEEYQPCTDFSGPRIRIVARIYQEYGSSDPKHYANHDVAADVMGFSLDISVEIEHREGEAYCYAMVQHYGDGLFHPTIEAALKVVEAETGIMIEAPPKDEWPQLPERGQGRITVATYHREFLPSEKSPEVIEQESPVGQENIKRRWQANRPYPSKVLPFVK